MHESSIPSMPSFTSEDMTVEEVQCLSFDSNSQGNFTDENSASDSDCTNFSGRIIVRLYISIACLGM